MQKVRGFLFFEGKSIEEIKSRFNGFRLDSLNCSLFDDFAKDGKPVYEKGVFVYGEADSKYSSADIVNILRKNMGMEDLSFQRKDFKGKTHYIPIAGMCDLSIGEEDFMKPIKPSKANGSYIIQGNYIGVRIMPPLNIIEVEDTASRKIATLAGVKNVYLRGVEIDEITKELPKICLEVITDRPHEESLNLIKKALNSKKIDSIRTARLFI